MENLRWCNCCVVFVKRKNVYKFATIKTFLSVISNLLIHVWLFSTTTNFTVTGIQLICTKY